MTEDVTSRALRVVGELPRALCGTYLRNGPNPKTGFSPHWWFGDGMIHGVCLADGEARWYRNRYLRTSAFTDEPAPSRLRGGGRSNTNVIELGGRLLSLVETALPMEIARELKTVGIFDFGGVVDTPMTAHPKQCLRTGELHFFGFQFTRPFLTWYVADAGG